MATIKTLEECVQELRELRTLGVTITLTPTVLHVPRWPNDTEETYQARVYAGRFVEAYLRESCREAE